MPRREREKQLHSGRWGSPQRKCKFKKHKGHSRRSRIKPGFITACAINTVIQRGLGLIRRWLALRRREFKKKKKKCNLLCNFCTVSGPLGSNAAGGAATFKLLLCVSVQRAFFAHLMAQYLPAFGYHRYLFRYRNVKSGGERQQERVWCVFFPRERGRGAGDLRDMRDDFI